MNKTYNTYFLYLIATGLTATPSWADITGSVNAIIKLDATCSINGDSNDDGATGVDFGSLDFGTHTTLFSTADAQVNSGGSAIAVECSPGVTPVLTFNAGLYDGQGTGGGDRAMKHATESSQYVTYSLYSDSGRQNVIAVGQGITLSDTGAAQSVDVYARAFGATGLYPGTYEDLITVTLEL